MVARILALFIFTMFLQPSGAQSLPVNKQLLAGNWSAYWITCPDVPQRDYGVYHFRKTFELVEKPEKFIVHVSGDNRYRLWVNETPVCSGPARGDLFAWNFETVDLAPFLKAGRNVITALVWNMGEHAPVAQVSNQTAFMVQGDTDREKIVNTNASWKVIKNTAYTPCSTDNRERLRSFMVIGPGDELDASVYPWGWEKEAFDDKSWLAARQLVRPISTGTGAGSFWMLSPRTIPLMEETFQRIPSIRRVTGMRQPKNDFISGKDPWIIPAHTKVSILLDQTFNTVAYPELITSGGKGAAVKMTYAEALLKNPATENYNKGNRNEIEGKEIVGNYDIFKPDGGDKRLFRPLWLRTFRYLQLDIETQAQPLILQDLYGQYTGYPFEQKATFRSSDLSLQNIWEVGWRTARLCAGETYYDCPYYEQLQYVGDTRIQALISLYVTGDDRLVRKALMDFYQSRIPEGLTQSRYPSNRTQVIPPFSLFWISMVYDYWMHRKDEDFIQQFLPVISGILNWYERNIDENKKMLGPMPWWNFVDYTDAFRQGVPEGANDGNSSIITLQYVYALRQASSMFEHFGQSYAAAQYKNQALEFASNTYRQCYDPSKGLISNTPEKIKFSQHASILAILTDAIPEAQANETMQKILKDASLGPVTYYWQFYLTQALKKVGMADLYYDQLTPWRNMLQMGLTTFAEKPEPVRSDCHAWSASPNYDFLATICGIMPDAPGFEKVLIQPALGKLNEISGSMPHPKGMITVSLKRKNKNEIEGEVTLPENVQGRFVWNGKVIPLREGKQKIKF